MLNHALVHKGLHSPSRRRLLSFFLFLSLAIIQNVDGILMRRRRRKHKGKMGVMGNEASSEDNPQGRSVDEEDDWSLFTDEDKDEKRGAGYEKIVGGNMVIRRGRYPYIVPILNSENLANKETSIDQYCVGTLIAPDVVLTAAHCQGRQGKSPDFVQFNPWYRITRFFMNTRRIKTLKVIRQVPHPEFQIETFQHDVMLLKLNKKIPITPVKLAQVVDFPDGQTVRVAGWGSTSETDDSSPVLRQVDLQYLSNELCTSDEFGYGPIIDDETMMCAIGNGKDACFGDSGGPLIITDPNADSATSDVQIGLVSWGFGCADPFYPGVYAKVDFDWIQNTMCDPVTGVSPETCIFGKMY